MSSAIEFDIIFMIQSVETESDVADIMQEFLEREEISNS